MQGRVSYSSLPFDIWPLTDAPEIEEKLRREGERDREREREREREGREGREGMFSVFFK